MVLKIPVWGTVYSGRTIDLGFLAYEVRYCLKELRNRYAESAKISKFLLDVFKWIIDFLALGKMYSPQRRSKSSHVRFNTKWEPNTE